ncbi:MAG: SMP-30/gluconolactonase/LRE family protein [Betaproteobacteria bacterium]|nr:SMP-30/gluconolactonase/LRE family protein [Betaproteobacteria bacterium]
MPTGALEGEVLASGLRFPEGPVALSDGSVLVVELERGTLTRIAGGSADVVAHVGGGPNGAAIGPDGHCYVCNNGGSIWTDEPGGVLRPIAVVPGYKNGAIQRVDLRTGRGETLYTHCGGVPLKAPNDLVFDGSGGFWFTDFGRTYDRVRDLGAVYYARADGSAIRQVIFPIQAPNGIGLSPDGATLYVTETETARLWSYPVSAPGKIELEPWPSPCGGKLVIGTPGYQRFDSIAVEASGNVCVACLVDAGVLVVSPQGAVVEFLRAMDPFCTNLCFGGSDLQTAYVTLSGFGQLLAAPGLAKGWPEAWQRH